ncbi:helix-turn-helix domain-containing protein [Micromonospora sp. WMMD558]|uniref:helix-turn-helix domain-containing protein n=1 Tax=unclassified Micromonospora TaxID=2617518 RepID=UPI0012B44B91|nr:helix-turn-helix transcriptional regulator [Micromonospora sp. WMMC415]QGN47907.1 helix-turn-helix domain-containing protein [Micromonospora sp. WMMC415]
MSVSASEFLLAELRRQRTLAGLTQDELGERAHFSGKQVSAVELGTRPPREDYLAAIDKALDTGGLFVRLWSDLVKDDAAPVWLREWIEFEREAVPLRWYEPADLPGLLQTEAYARATLAGVPLPAARVDQLVSARLTRQEILQREDPPQMLVVIDEMALRRPMVNHASVMAQQFRLLLDRARQPNIQVAVIPATAGLHPGLQGGFILATLPDGSAVAHLDQQVRAQVVAQAEDIVTLQGMWETVRGEALSRSQSLTLIEEVARPWI